MSDRGSSAEEFRRALENPEIAVSAELAGDSRTLLVAFGGMVGKVGIPPFEFFSLTADIAVKRLFVRDVRQAWYHCGIPGHGGSLPEVAESLRALIARERIERLVVAGTSAGGYAALLFGTLLGAETVLSFAPQTVLDLEILSAMGDHRWDDRLSRQAAAGRLDERLTDLRSVLSGLRNADTRYRIYFADSLPADRLHAERLGGLAGVRLYRFGHASHNIARTLRDTGALRQVLRGALRAPGPAQRAAKFGHRPRSISG